MPNHCQNRLIVTGTAEHVAAFKDAVRASDGTHETPFSIAATVPELPEGDPRRVPSDTCMGGWDWYNWRLRNWGTKWDVYECELVTDTATRLVYRFQTAWDPPKEAIRRTSVAFPNVTLKLAYMEAGMQFYGHETWENKQTIDEHEARYTNDDYDYPDDEDGEAFAVGQELKAHVEEHGFDFFA